MGRHRRSAAGRAATGRATGVTQTYDTYAGGYAAADSGDYAGEGDYATAGDHLTAGDYLNGSPYATAGMYDSPGGIHETGDLYSKSDSYLFAADPAAHATTGYAPDGGGRGHRRRRKNVTPVRTGLLGVSAAVAMGAVAVASGLIPGSDSLSIGGGNADKVRAQDSPSDVQTQGGTDGTTDDREDSGTSRDLERSASPTVSPTKAPEKTEKKTPPRSRRRRLRSRRSRRPSRPRRRRRRRHPRRLRRRRCPPRPRPRPRCCRWSTRSGRRPAAAR